MLIDDFDIRLCPCISRKILILYRHLVGDTRVERGPSLDLLIVGGEMLLNTIHSKGLALELSLPFGVKSPSFFFHSFYRSYFLSLNIFVHQIHY